MGRQKSDPTMVSSSIALLQERFRQLERVREQREEKELLKLFSESERIAPSMAYEPAKLSFQPVMNYSSRPTLQDSLSLGLNLHNKHADYRAMNTLPMTSLWPSGAASASTSNFFENSDVVDTSLRL